MSKFERGIKNPKFLDALNDLRKDPESFWSHMVEDKDLFIGIRNESINVYYQGNSLAKITFYKGQVKYSTHYKFLINPDINNPYIETEGDIFQTQKLIGAFISSIKQINLIKRAINVYSGEEKSGVHTISLKASNVLDVEIALEKENVEDNIGRKTTDRIDFLRVEEHNCQLRLVFYETKHYSNKEIRASKENDAPVLDQLKRYEKSLEKHKADIITSYKLVCQNLQKLNIIGNRLNISSIADGNSFEIDPWPRLVIFGFDQDQKDGIIFKFHMDKLKSKIGKRLIIKGGAKSFNNI